MAEKCSKPVMTTPEAMYDLALAPATPDVRICRFDRLRDCSSGTSCVAVFGHFVGNTNEECPWRRIFVLRSADNASVVSAKMQSFGTVRRRGKLPNESLGHIQLRKSLPQLNHFGKCSDALLPFQRFRQLISFLWREDTEPNLVDLGSRHPEL
jgi:hypothetical protein